MFFFVIHSTFPVNAAGLDSDIQGPANRLQIIQAWKRILALEEYQVIYQLIYQKNQAIIMKANLLVDEKLGALDMKLTYYPQAQLDIKEGNLSKSLPIHILSRNHLQDVFVDSSSILRQLDKANVNMTKFKELGITDKSFIKIDQVQGPSKLQIRDLTKSIKLLPNLSGLYQLSNQQISRIGNSFKVFTSRLAIPQDILRFEDSLSFINRYNINIAKPGEERAQVNLDFAFDWKLNQAWFSWLYDFRVDYLDLNLTPRQIHNAYEFKASQTTDKLIHYKFILDPQKSTYQAELIGLVEEFDLNIFSNQTAKYYTSKYQLNIEVKPLQTPLLDEKELDILDIKQFQDILTQGMTK